MKIGILSTCENYSWTGTEEVWYHFAKCALEHGHQVLLGAHQAVAAAAQTAELRRLNLVVCSRKPWRPTRWYLAKERFRSEMKALSDCEVLLVNAGSLYDPLNLPWIGQFLEQQRMTGQRIVYFCHFCAESLPATGYSRDALQRLVECASEWVFVSQHNLELASRQLATAFEKASVVMNGPRLQMSAPLPMPSGEARFGCVARLETRWKGHDVLMQCLSSARWRERDWSLNIYGSGPDEAYVASLIQHFNLQSRVNLCGYVRDMREVWSQCHAMVLASHGEGTPLAVLEAMMCGRTVITTDVGGNREILEDQVTGFIADAATPRSFGATLEIAWSRRSNWGRMGGEAHLVATRLAKADPAAKLLAVIAGGL